MGFFEFLKFNLQNIVPSTIILYLIVIIAVIYILGKYDLPMALWIPILLLLLGTTIIYESTLSWIYYLLLFIIFCIIVVTIFVFARSVE